MNLLLYKLFFIIIYNRFNFFLHFLVLENYNQIHDSQSLEAIFYR